MRPAATRPRRSDPLDFPASRPTGRIVPVVPGVLVEPLVPLVAFVPRVRLILDGVSMGTQISPRSPSEPLDGAGR
jgi:hypothetical protein